MNESRPLRLVVTGREGQVARSLVERGPAWGVSVVALGRPALDLADPTTLGALRQAEPDVIVNAAAYTAVDRAESEPGPAWQINAAGAGAIAETAAKLRVPVLQLSTDYVFDGTCDRPYREDDTTGPINGYGRSKLAGEQAVAAATHDHVILRTSWVYSPFGSNFVRTMLRAARGRPELSVVDDQHGCPTLALDLADGVLRVARNLVEQPGRPDLRGIFHIAGSDDTTWFGFAQAIFAASAARGGPVATVTPVATAAYPTPARRPANSRLDCSKLARLHGVTLPPWPLSVDACVARLLETMDT